MGLFVEVLRSSLFAAIPILLAALGGAYTYHANVFNIAMEGMMLIGAFCAILGSFFSGSWVVGVLAGVAGGGAAAVLFLLFVVYLRTDEFITGIAVNMLALGGTTYALRQIFHVKGAFMSPDIASIPSIRLPGVDLIPVVGDVLSGLPVIIYAGILLVGIVHYHFYHTRYGLRLRASGEAATAVDSVGVSSNRMKSTAILSSGILCGLAGTALSLAYVTLFVENMSNGRGWIALTVIILTRGRPLGMIFMALLFGFFDGVGITLQGLNIPSQFAQMTPYLVTLVALYFYSRRKRLQVTGNAAESGEGAGNGS